LVKKFSLCPDEVAAAGVGPSGAVWAQAEVLGPPPFFGRRRAVGGGVAGVAGALLGSGWGARGPAGRAIRLATLRAVASRGPPEAPVWGAPSTRGWGAEDGGVGGGFVVRDGAWGRAPVEGGVTRLGGMVAGAAPGGTEAPPVRSAPSSRKIRDEEEDEKSVVGGGESINGAAD